MESFQWLNRVCIALAITLASAFPVCADNFLVYFGTYTGPGGKGIYVSSFDTASGRLTPPQLAVETTDPSYLAVAPDHQYLYAVNEIPGTSGFVSAFKLEPTTGRLEFLDEQPSGGFSPCHLTIDPNEKFMAVANYNSGNVEVLPIRPNGFLAVPVCLVQHHGSSVNAARQAGPHAHCVAFDADNRLYVCDLGLDKVMIYHLDENNGQLATNEIPWVELKPGSGPRHIAFYPDGKYAYVISEMGSAVTAFAYDPSNGKLTTIQTVSTLPGDFHGNNTSAEIAIHRSGKFLYASNRGGDSIAVFAVDEKTGKLTRVQIQPTLGRTPRGFALDPTGQFLIVANQDSDDIVVFRISPENGKLTATGQKFEIGKPVCVAFVPARPPD